MKIPEKYYCDVCGAEMEIVPTINSAACLNLNKLVGLKGVVVPAQVEIDCTNAEPAPVTGIALPAICISLVKVDICHLCLIKSTNLCFNASGELFVDEKESIY